MEFITAGFEIIEQQPGLEGIFKAIELPGRICYGSQDKITADSAKKFCDMLMISKHSGVLEHGTVYLKIRYYDIEGMRLMTFFTVNPYSKVKTDNEFMYITTNLRVLFENDLMPLLDKYLCEPTEMHEQRVCVRFTIDRFTGEEFLRHRVASFNRESTRYVLFTKEKFGGGSIKYIIPVWMLDKQDVIQSYNHYDISEFCRDVIDIESGDLDCMYDVFVWMFALKSCEWSYNKLVNDFDWKAEQARTVLPCAINSPLIKTAFTSDWVNFFNLRAIGTTGRPHPQALELAEPLMNEFIERGYLKREDMVIK